MTFITGKFVLMWNMRGSENVHSLTLSGNCDLMSQATVKTRLHKLCNTEVGVR